MPLTKEQIDLVEIIEETAGDEIDAIGEPSLDGDGNILVDFQYGENTYTAKINPEDETIVY